MKKAEIKLRTLCVSVLILGEIGIRAKAQKEPETSTPYRAPNEIEERAAERWLAANAVPLSGAIPTAADRRPIVERLSGARIIGLGEATHGTHEDQAFKVELIKALVQAGAIDTVAFEANRAAIASFDRYVRMGAGNLEALMRSDSVFRGMRTDELADLLSWLRKWNRQAAKPVMLAGIDVQDSGHDSDESLAFVKSVDPAAAARWRENLQSVLTPDAAGQYPDFMKWGMSAPSDQFAKARSAADGLRDWYEAGIAKYRGKPGFDDGRAAARFAWQGFTVVAPFNNADASKLPAEAWERRDQFMSTNLLSLTDGGHRIALLVHNAHALSQAPDAYRRRQGISLGMLVRDAIGPAYRTVGVTWSQATVLLTTKSPSDTAYFPKVNDQPVALANDGPATLGGEFARAMPANVAASWIDLDRVNRAPELSGWRQRAVYKGELGWFYEPAKWQKGRVERAAPPVGQGFDILVWFRQMTPSHRWAEPISR